jgi:hypothetical protein
MLIPSAIVCSTINLVPELRIRCVIRHNRDNVSAVGGKSAPDDAISPTPM